jgi:hypothetical protein
VPGAGLIRIPQRHQLGNTVGQLVAGHVPRDRVDSIHNRARCVLRYVRYACSRHDTWLSESCDPSVSQPVAP